MIEEQPWSALRPRGWARRFTVLVVALGFGRGAMRQKIRRFWLRSGPPTVVDVMRHGLRWRVDFSDNASCQNLLFSSKEQDRHEIRMLRTVCSTGVFVDIGANIGYYTVRLASAGARVLALEPNPVVYRRMLVNLSLNGLIDRVVTMPIGIGEAGETTLFLDGRDLGCGSTVAPDAAANPITIRTSPLADILASQGIREIAAMKVDVEGTEDQVLLPSFRSAPRDMWPRCLIIEECLRDRWETDIVSLLRGEGYRNSMRTHLNIVLTR